MPKVILICGKICCGKSFYSNYIKNKENAVILSCDEVTSTIFNNNLGESHDKMTALIKKYLLNKSVDIINANTSVILDWGFWSKIERLQTKDFFESKNIECELHYINIDDESWQKNIAERNTKVQTGENTSDFYLDEGLLNKLSRLWEEPNTAEVNVWYNLKR